MGGLGYLVKRHIEGAAPREKLERTKTVLELHHQMKQSGLSVEEVADLETALTGRKADLRKIEDRIANEVAQEVGRNFTTQAEMNDYASRSAIIAESKMTIALQDLMQRADEKLRPGFEAAQSAWAQYAKKEAEAVASQFEGGSMQPMIFSSEMERLSIERAASLQAVSNSLVE